MGRSLLRNVSLEQVPLLFKQVVLALALWTVWYLSASFMSRAASGYCVIVHAFIVVVAAVRIARHHEGDLRALRRSPALCFTASYLVWAASDFCWAINYFIAGQSSKETLGIIVTTLCAACFVLSIVGIVEAMEGRACDFFDARVFVTSTAVSTSIVLAMLFFPYISDGSQDRWSLFGVSEMIAVCAGYVLLILAIAVMLSSRTMEWSIYGAGVMCWVLGDTAIRIGKILDDSINVDGYSVLCSFGLYASLFALLSEQRRPRIDRPDFRSIYTTSKFGFVAIIFLCLFVFLFSQTNNLDTVRLITLCCALASFGAIFWSTFLVFQIRKLSAMLGSVLKGDIGSDSGIEPDVSGLPLELREHYDYVFATSVREQKNRESQRSLDAQNQALRRVAHNILSPVAALNSQLADLDILPEESRVIMKTAIRDVNDMANAFSNVGKKESRDEAVVETTLLSSIVDVVVSQKRLQYRLLPRVEITSDLTPRSYGLFARANARDLKSILSNLINNSVEAFDDKGVVMVSLRAFAHTVEILITDNGRGIPASILPKLGTSGFTFGKAKGSGIGLHHARTTLEAWGGTLQIESNLGVGTVVTARLPLAPPPPWFVPSVQLRRDGVVVVVDDNPAIHQVWAKRFAAAGTPPEVVHINSTEGLRQWHADQTGTLKPLYLVDLEFMQGAEDGLTLIESLGIAKQSILVTSHHDNADVRDDCERLGVGLIPKTVAALVPIKPAAKPHEQANFRYDAVFIDNEAMYRNVWKKSAREHGKRVLAFATVEEFKDQEALIDRATPIYIDSDLGGGVLGEYEAEQIRHGLGFSEIYLATAHTWCEADRFPWLSGVVGKNPPWQPDPWFGRNRQHKAE